MSDKYMNKYRNESARLKGYDYSSPGAYFITICAKDRKHYFGEIENGKMILSQIGNMAETYMKQIPDHFPFVKLNEFIIMPDHIHGIIIIEPIVGTPNLGVPTIGVPTSCLDVPDKTSNNNNYKPGSLGVIINQFKRMCTLFARTNKIEFNWQSRFHDHIIRNNDEFMRIKKYISSNPINWNIDVGNSE